jgi:hypothetical protein
LAYDGERVDTAVLDQLETILRHVQEELAAWRARALKAEGDLKEHPGQARATGPVRHDPEVRARVSDVEQENKHLKQRVEAARVRVGELLSRLTFLEDQAREPGGGNGGGRSGGSAAGGRAGGAGTPEGGTA